MPRSSDSKQLKSVIKQALEQGWEVGQTKKNHWKFKSPDKNQSPIVTSWSPSDHHSILNCIARLRRAGLKIKS